MDIAGDFEAAEEQIAVLKLAIELRKERRRPTPITAIMHLRDLVRRQGCSD